MKKLTEIGDGGRALSLEEYLRKKSQGEGPDKGQVGEETKEKVIDHWL
jgi:hypothetical protein